MINKLLDLVEEINKKLNDIDGLSSSYLVYAECVRSPEDEYTAIKITDHTLWDHWGDVTSFNEEELEHTKELVYEELYDFLRTMSLYFRVVAKEVGDNKAEDDDQLNIILKQEEFAKTVKFVTKGFREDVMVFVSEHGKSEKKQFSPIDLMDMINNLEDKLLDDKS